MPDHPLGSLFVLLQGRITAYEGRVSPVPAASPERVLVFLMEQRDMTQTHLASVLGINQANVSRLLNSKSQFTVETVQVLAGYFHVNTGMFLISTPFKTCIMKYAPATYRGSAPTQC